MWFSQFFNDDDEPAHSAWLALTFLIFVDILGIVWLIEGILGTTFVAEVTKNRLVTIGTGVLLMIVTHYCFYRRPRRKEIFEELAAVSLEKKSVHKKIALGFFVFSILFCIGSVIVSVFLSETLHQS